MKVKNHTVDAKSTHEIYRLRWQEEILFEATNPLMDLDTIHSRKVEKIFSEIYAKLMLYSICSRMRNTLEQQKKEKEVYSQNWI